MIWYYKGAFSILRFYFTLKSLFVLKRVRFLSQLVEKRQKCMTSQPEKQTIAIYVLRSISRSKCNQTIKFGQLTEYNMKNIFPEKSCI